MYCIIVTYGNMPNMMYASSSSYDDIRKLLATAKSLGYRDAKIVKDK